jgi:hypothetical protein
VEARAATLKGHAASRGPAKLPISDYGRIRDSGVPTIYPPRPRPRHYHSKSQNSYPSDTDSISFSQETYTLHRDLFIPFITPYIPCHQRNSPTQPSSLPAALPLYHSPSTQHGTPPRVPCCHVSHTPSHLCQSISAPKHLYLVGVWKTAAAHTVFPRSPAALGLAKAIRGVVDLVRVRHIEVDAGQC